MEQEVKICRLCLALINDANYEVLEDTQREMIKIVSIPLNLSVSEAPVICSSCSHCLQMCYDFKITCLNTEACVKSVAGCQEHVKMNLQDVVLKVQPKENVKIEVPKEICRLCFSSDSNSYLKLDSGEVTILKMLKKYVPELNLSSTTDPQICCNCVDSLERGCSFVKSCLETEEKIKKYCSVQDNTVNKADLRKVSLHLTEVKTEVKSRTEVEFVACQPDTIMKSEVVENDNNPSRPEPRIILVNQAPFSETRTLTCKQCDYETRSKRDFKIHCFSHGKGKKLYECPLCPFITRHRTVITNHELTHKSLDEIDWHQCQICTYRTKLKANLRNHMQTHKKPEEVKRFKCEECPYRTVWRRDLDRHLLKHKKPDQVTMYKCDYCGFTTKHERYLKQHVAKLHLGVGEADDNTYSCANCNFTTKLKRSLVPHMLIHRNPEDLTIYRCSVCPYQAKWKESVKKHELTHKHKFKCDECDFKTTLKRFLDKHKLAHRSLEGAPKIYSCDQCNYQTLRKNGVQNHMLVHKSADEVTMHACPHCDYKTKRLQDMKQHVLIIHTDNITVYSCEHCPYQTKYKYNYRQHTRTMHLGPTEVKLHKCDQCDFATKYKSSLVSHVVSYHKPVEEITMIKCPTCNFETKRRECLRMHLVTHKRPEELEMFKCDDCGFQTKYKRALKKHMTGHRPGERETQVYRCNWCGFETKWKQTIRKHRRRHEEVGEGDDGWVVVNEEVKTIKEEALA